MKTVGIKPTTDIIKEKTNGGNGLLKKAKILVCVIVVAALVMIGSITACRTAKRGLEYRASDGGFAVVTCEDGTVYLRTEDRGTWFSTADAKIDCGKGTYADEYESPFGTTYAMQKRFTVYTYDPTTAENKTPEKEN